MGNNVKLCLLVVALVSCAASFARETQDAPVSSRRAAPSSTAPGTDAIVAWAVAGPFRTPGAQGNATLAIPYAPEKGKPVTWHPFPVTAGDQAWKLDLRAVLGDGQDCSAYLYTNLVATEDRKVVLELGSDDGVAVWLRGAAVHANPALRGCSPAQDRVTVDLRKGANPLVLKVANRAGGWAATLRLRTQDGRKVDGVTPDPTPPVKPMTLQPVDIGPTSKIERSLPSKPVAEPKKPRRLLVFTLTRGFRHGSIPTGVLALTKLGEKTGAFTVTHSEDIAVFEKPSLDRFDGLCFLSTTGELFTHPRLDQLDAGDREEAVAREKRLKANLLAFVESGKGLCGIHAATDTFYRFEEYGKLIGGYFDGHPWHEKVGLTVEEPDHPLVKMFEAEKLEIIDEIYQIKKPYSRFQQRVLISLDKMRTNMEKKGIRRKDGDFPISWVKRYGESRVFYCSLGHRDEIYWNSAVLEHYLAGLQYILGDLEAPDAPRK